MEISQITTIVFVVLYLLEVFETWQLKKIIKELEDKIKWK